MNEIQINARVVAYGSHMMLFYSRVACVIHVLLTQITIDYFKNIRDKKISQNINLLGVWPRAKKTPSMILILNF